MNAEEANGSTTAAGSGGSGAPNPFESGVPIYLTPYKLALLILVKEFVVLSASAEDDGVVRDEEQLAIFGHTRPQLASFLIAEVKALATDREKTLNEFVEAMSAYKLDEIVDGLREQVMDATPPTLAPCVADLVVGQQLDKLCQSPDEVYELFRELSSLLEAPQPGVPHIVRCTLTFAYQH
jgi:hypothetical protein